MDVSHRRLRTQLLLIKKYTSAVRMPRGDPHQEFVVVQMLYNAATDKARAAKHGHNSIFIPLTHWGIPNRVGRSPRPHRSISPNTMSSDPMIAETSASMWPCVRKSMAERWANEGARIL